MKKSILLLCLAFSGQVFSQDSEKLLDKIVAVVNTRVISLSELDRMSMTVAARKEISPQVYNKSNFSQKELLDLNIQSFIIRDRINSQGYVISDDAVESRIKMTEDRLGLKRSDLLVFLKSKGLSFEEYFEIIREAMEYSIFAQRIITPLVSVTDQEIKNEFYKKHSSDRALAFKYDLIDFYVPQRADLTEAKFVDIVKNYQLTGQLPDGFDGMETSELEKISEDGLSVEFRTALNESIEGGFSKAVTYNGFLHLFFVKKKDLVESASYLKEKEKIEAEIYNSRSYQVSLNWFQREYQNYYIKINL